MLKTSISIASAGVAVAAALSASGFAILSRAQNDKQNCVAQSDTRVSSNNEIRIPLRETDAELARILRKAARQQGDEKKMEETIRLAVKFDGYAARVKLLAPLDC